MTDVRRPVVSVQTGHILVLGQNPYVLLADGRITLHRFRKNILDEGGLRENERLGQLQVAPIPADIRPKSRGTGRS